jgi:hypothetical protein
MSKAPLKVTLKDGNLAVNQKGNPHQIPHGEAKITWQLYLDDGHDGSFNELKDQDGPGFEWMDKPKPGIFDEPDVVVRDKKITVADHNTNPGGISSVGEWTYRLRATIDGDPYSTIYEPEP